MGPMWNLRTCFLLLISILLVGGFPTKSDTEPKNDENCIKMNPAIQKQINNLVNQISQFVNSITAEYDDIDIKQLAITIDRHFADEEEKNTVIELTVNDCVGDGKEGKDTDDDDKDDRKKSDVELLLEEENDIDEDDLFIDSLNESKVKEENDERDTNNDGEINDSSEEDLDDDEIKEDRKKSDVSLIAEEENDIDEDDLFIDSLNESKGKEENDERDTNNDGEINDSSEEDLDDDEIKEDRKKSDVSLIAEEENDIDEDDLFIDSLNESKGKKENDVKHIDKDIIPDVLYFMEFNDIINDTKVHSNEVMILNDEDKYFFKKIEEVRGNGAFLVYQRFFDNYQQFWFF